MAWQPGQSGNPHGRPKKHRTLTKILERAGSRTIEIEGQRISGKRLIARLMWDIAKEGRATLPDGRILVAEDFGDWLDVVKFLYSHIDGPPKTEADINLDGSLEVKFTWEDDDYNHPNAQTAHDNPEADDNPSG